MPSRDSRGRFKPGTTGNTKGRTPDPARRALRQQITDAAPEIVKALIQAARQGDAQAAKLIMDRCLPPLRPTDEPVKALGGATLMDRSEAVLQAAQQGEITPSEAATLMSTIGAAARIAEIDDLARRVEALERQT